MKCDDRKGQGISDEIEEIDGIKRLESSTQAW
jgi:hypothetical protein